MLKDHFLLVKITWFKGHGRLLIKDSSKSFLFEPIQHFAGQKPSLLLTLNKWTTRYFSSKVGLFENNKELQLGTCSLMANHAKSREQKRGIFFYRGKGELQGAVANRVHWRKLGVWSGVAFHWLSCNSLSLAEWLPGEEKISPFSCWCSRKTSSCWRWKVHVFLFGVIDLEW